MLAFLLNWLGGGVLKSVLGHLEKRKELELGANKLKTEITIAEIKAEQERRLAQRDVLLKEGDHWIAWLPRFLFGFGSAFYYCAILVDAIWDLPGEVLTLPDNIWPIMTAVVSGLFLEKAVKTWKS